MKTRYILLLTTFFLSGFTFLQAQSSGRNYVLTRTYLYQTGADYSDRIEYFDGLGRPMEAVQKGVTPTNKDLVSLQEYDAAGRTSNNWLPASVAGNGAYTAPSSAMEAARNTHTNPY